MMCYWDFEYSPMSKVPAGRKLSMSWERARLAFSMTFGVVVVLGGAGAWLAAGPIGSTLRKIRISKRSLVEGDMKDLSLVCERC